jgi:signal transduction histidine kinase/CheY-like chemotaxis protein
VKLLLITILMGLSLGLVLGALLYYFSLRRIARQLGIPVSGNIERSLIQGMRERSRTYLAATAFKPREGDLSGSLQSLIALAAEQLRAKSAELCLFDSESGLTAQSFIFGTPSSAFSRGTLSEEELAESASVFKEERDGSRLLLRPIRFSRKTFGVLQFEFPSRRKLTTADDELVGLFSQQVAVCLLESRFTEELLRMRQIGEDSQRAKTGFLANLSHELRGPLGIILNGTELALDGLCGGPLNPQLKETITMIQGNGKHLLDLVNDVLDYAKVEAGKITTKPTEIPLKPLLEDIMRIARGQAEQKRHKLELAEVSDTLGVVCDRRHLRQMLINLLTNAIKYTPDGGLISVAAVAGASGRVKISVKDSGVGIPENQRSKVFGAFERVEDGYSEKQAGTGLGMPLTKRLAEANGGGVEFDSTVGLGSTFYLTLPGCRIKREEDLLDAKGSTKTWVGRGERIVVLDSDESSRSILGRYLSDQGFKVAELTGPRELIQALKGEPIDLAIIDSNLEQMSSDEVILALRAHPEGANIPIILITPSAFSFDVENYLKLGVDLCLSKPIKLGECAAGARRLIDEAS